MKSYSSEVVKHVVIKRKFQIYLIRTIITPKSIMDIYDVISQCLKNCKILLMSKSGIRDKGRYKEGRN